MRIKEVESLVGITKKNIRFYEKEGLLSPARDMENSYREYSEEDVSRLRVIKLLRRLDMPISEIADILEGRIGLGEALHLHSLMLEEQRSNIAKCKRVCDHISSDCAGLDSLDTEKYLQEMEREEEHEQVFVNISAKDTDKRYKAMFTVSVVIIAMMMVFSVVLIVMLAEANAEVPTPILAICAIVVITVGTIIAAASRLKEIREENNDDISKY